MPSTEYPKITGPFKRDPQTNKLTDEWATRELEDLAGANIWYFTEKVDGTNVRIFWDGYRVTYSGRTDNAVFSADQEAALKHLFAGEDNENLFEQQFGVEPAILYGELYGPKIQKGGVYRDDITYTLFDVKRGGLWLFRQAVEDVAAGLGIDAAPLILDGVNVQMAIDHVKVGLYSEIALESKAATFSEGLVGYTRSGLLDRRGNRISVKIKHRDFYEGSR